MYSLKPCYLAMCVNVKRWEIVCKEQMFKPRSSGAVSLSAAPARHKLAGRTRSSLGQNPAKPPLSLAPLKHYFAFAFRNDKYTRAKPARPRAVWPLQNRSEGEVNIFQGFEVNPELQRHPAQFFQPFSLHSSRGEKWHGESNDRLEKRVLSEQFCATYCMV